MKPTISTIMGIYNCADTPEESLTSIEAQTFTDWELIMCDDGSNDDTLVIAEQFAEKYPDKAVVLKNEKNLGLNATLNKCLAVAINTMAKSSNVKCFVRDEGDLKEYLASLIEENHLYDKVYLLGYGKDIPQMCDAADTFIFPTLQEGLPVVLMESMANGLPVLCSNVRGNVDLIENGKGGFTYDKYDAEGFAKGIDILANDADLRKKMTEHNLSKIEDFSLRTSKGCI